MASRDQGWVTPVDVLDRAMLPTRVRCVLAQLLSDVTAATSAPLALALHHAQLALRNAGTIGDRRTQEHYATSVDQLRAGAHGIQSRFADALAASLAGIRGPACAAPKSFAAPVELSLSLLDDEAASDEAMLEATASRAEVRNSLALQLLAHRLGVLAGQPCFELEDMPLGPHRLTRAFVDAIVPLHLSPQAHVALFEQFDAHVMTAYPAILDVINGTLVGQGILPHLSFIPIRPRLPARRDPGEAPAHVAEGAPSLDASAAIAPGKAASGPARPTLAAPGDARFQALLALLHDRRTLLAKLRPGGPAAAFPFVPPEMVAQVLRGMRALPDPIDTLASARGSLLQRARDLQGHGVALSESDVDTFELLDLFFERLQRELQDGSVGDLLLRRLRLPLLQVALRDQRFFVDAGHPARQLLDAVSLAGARWLGDDDLVPQWLAALQHAVATIELDADTEPATFALANRVLQERLQVLARGFELSERRQVEAARGREKLALARMHATDQIVRRIRGRALPRFESILLSQAWADVLALAHLRHVEGSDAWDRLMGATTRIVDRAAGEPDGAPDPALFGIVGTSLEQVGYHSSDAQAIAAQLTGCGGEAADASSRTGLLLQLRARARLGEGVAASAGPPPLDEAAQLAFDRMKRAGAKLWIVRGEAPGRHVRRRLAWASARTGQTLLVNRRGQRVPGEELDVLAQGVASGAIQLLSEDLAPSETAWRAMHVGLQQLAGGPPAATPKEGGDGH